MEKGVWRLEEIQEIRKDDGGTIVFVIGIEFGSIYSYIIVFFLRRKYDYYDDDNEEVVRIMKMFFWVRIREK